MKIFVMSELLFRIYYFHSTILSPELYLFNALFYRFCLSTEQLSVSPSLLQSPSGNYTPSGTDVQIIKNYSPGVEATQGPIWDSEL